ncbi:predicted protein [Histoplasma capsulatum G186AR]|uniref:Uncharacterized protein n=1 Tax=Ajellomyces capsulatus (strain G186AR / H82 / ATCC MYA-2454 / RMSCC 2432) TaxID=447093 RepID=C0NV87_AJECG|nr:uncharacterized protein HCBG_07067 [Histoplasma capsulatum G186AR]EEH04426.1 predicted protein [Histoplasma capsulatum G186AR]
MALAQPQQMIRAYKELGTPFFSRQPFWPNNEQPQPRSVKGVYMRWRRERLHYFHLVIKIPQISAKNAWYRVRGGFQLRTVLPFLFPLSFVYFWNNADVERGGKATMTNHCKPELYEVVLLDLALKQLEGALS